MALYPPRSTCQALYKLHPQLRFAWHSYERKEKDELNPGSFAIVQLYHIKDAGTEELPNTYLLHWTEAGEGRGPIFDRWGGCTRDWDPLFRKPIYVANLKEYGIEPSEVYSGAVIDTVRYWLIPAARRLRENERELSQKIKDKVDSIVEPMTDFLWREAQHHSAESVIMPWKNCREQMATWDRQRAQAKKLYDYYKQPGM